MITINSNTPSLNIQSSLRKTTDRLNELTYQIATGKRINTAKDDPAGFVVGQRMNTDYRSYGAVLKNLSTGTSLLNTTNLALADGNSVLQEMRALAVEASSDILSADQRAAIGSTFTQLQAQYDEIMNGATLFGQNLVGSSAADVDIQTGISSSSSTTVVSVQSDAATLGVDAGSIDVTDSANAQSAIDAIDTAINTNSVTAGTMGSQMRGFEMRTDNVEGIMESIKSSLSKIEDLDVAQATAELSLLQTQQQMTIGLLGLVNSLPQNALSLLR